MADVRRRRTLARVVATLALVSLLPAGCQWKWAARVNVRPDAFPVPIFGYMALAGDGTMAAFQSHAQLFPPFDNNTGTYMRDLTTGTTSAYPFLILSVGLDKLVLDGGGRYLVGLNNADLGLRVPVAFDIETGELIGATQALGFSNGGSIDISDHDDQLTWTNSNGGHATVYDLGARSGVEHLLPGVDIFAGLFALSMSISADGSALSYVLSDELPTLRTLDRATSNLTIHTGAVPAGSTLVDGRVSDDLSTVVAQDEVGTLYHSAFGASGPPELASVGPDGSTLAASSRDFHVSDDGRVIAFESGGAVYVRNVEQGVTRQVAPPVNGVVEVGGLSADGSLVQFSSAAPGIAAGDDDDQPDVFVVASFGPALDSVAPASAAAGTTTTLTLTGSGFTPETSATVSGSGVTADETTYVSATELRVSITVSPTADSGARNVIVREPGPGIDSGGFRASGSACLGCLTIT
jgi:hypothetical protein